MEDNHEVNDNTSQQSMEGAPSSMTSPYTEVADATAPSPVNGILTKENAPILQLLMAEMQRLREDFDTKVKYDESKERLIESLHRELQVYREGLHFKILRPLFVDLIGMYDDLGKLIEAMPAQDSATASSLAIQNMESFQETIEETLQRNGVEAFIVKENTFVANKQRIVRVVDTSDPSQDKQIVRRVRKGFEYEGRILRPEVVEIYKYNPVSS